MRSTLAAAIALAFRENRFLEAASLIREIPAGMRSFKRQKIKRPGKYLPSVCGPSLVKNPAVAAQMNSMHDRWYAARFA